MRIGSPSDTAIATASMRAAHVGFYEGPYIHEDPFAVQLATNGSMDELRGFLTQRGYTNLRRVCAYFAFRHRFSEDRLRGALARGVSQIVLLGAGLDTFALRCPQALAGKLYLEVDHPDSQRWKLERLAALGLKTPSVVYVPMDFERQDLAHELEQAGLRRAEPTFFQWLGVTVYIPLAAVDKTLSLIARHSEGTEVVFDFILPFEEIEGEDLVISSAAKRAGARRGEPWITFFRPQELEQHLRHIGFSEVVHMAPEMVSTVYYDGQPARVTPMAAWRVMAAVVGAPPKLD